MTEHVHVGGLLVAKVLFDFVNNEAIPGTGLDADQFWAGADKVIHDLAPKNKALLAKRDDLQARIDAWHQAQAGKAHDAVAYKAFLQDIGYLQPEAADFQATTQNVDDEIARMAGPQLVVPVMNARFALNASNARWGSLYDALYGTDAISEADGAEKGKGYNKVRGDKVIAFARAFLDEAAPLAQGSHVDSTAYAIVGGALQVTLKDGTNTGLRDTAQLIGYHGDAAAPTAVLIKHNGLHFEIQIDATSPVGQTDAAGVKDVLMEAALTTIMDCEDSVAAVDADDKVVIYRNWLGLMKGDLSEQVSKGGQTFTRTMNPDREYTTPEGATVSLHGRSLLFAAGWDLLVVDEAHHLVWHEDKASPEYSLVEQLAEVIPGVLLLTATPEQLGQDSHFARLRLLDPNRFHDLHAFRAESENYRPVAEAVQELLDKGRLSPTANTR